MDVKVRSILSVLACLLGMYLFPYCGAACDPGWFGEHCEYRCRCSGYKCDDYGRCIDGARCVSRWFGPSCQYEDLTYNTEQPKVWWQVIDGDDSTCVKNLQETSMTVRILKSLFSWLRVHVNNPNFLHNLTVQFKSDQSLPCINQRSSVVDDRTLDIHCDLKEIVESVTLTGEGVQYLCSLYVSGGRNVALKQATSQSSNYSEKRVVYSSDKAVDGYTNPDFGKGHCSSTRKTVEPSWTLNLSKPHNINRFVIYNREGEHKDRITGFTIKSFNENEVQLFDYTDPRELGIPLYWVTTESIMSSVSRVMIQLNSQNYLTLCEVQVYGDSACEPKWYGRDCEHRCNCAGDEACFVSTGGCPSGCADGYRGEACDRTCDAGKYGKDCSMNCSEFCQPANFTQDSPCHYVHGECKYGCQAGYEGKTCSGASSPSKDTGTKDADNVVGPVIGALFAVIILVAVVAFGFIFYRRHKKPQPVKLQVKPNDMSDGSRPLNGSSHSFLQTGTSTPVTTRNSNLEPQDKQKSHEAGRESDSDDKAALYYNTPSGQSSTAVALADLDIFMRSRRPSFFKDQFTKIPANEKAAMTVALSTENKHKNRYKNISAYDHSRVHLTINISKKQGDYINASFVEGYKSDERFIASQGPTKIMLDDFVRMLWEQEVEKVVMLTNLVEDGKQKCEMYWPEEGEMKVGEITVKLATTQIFANYTIRRLQLEKEGSTTVQNVTHFHFTAWPDKDIPTAPWGLVDFEQRVAMYPTSKPIVVHCSAGVGRTGTFIALRNVMRQAEETRKMDFFKAVEKLRHDRINMVQTADQYIFLHKAAQVAMLCIGTTVTLGDIQNTVKKLKTRSPTGETWMEIEFKAVCSACDDKCEETSSEHISSNAVYENNQSINNQKNRVGSAPPKDAYRAILAKEDTTLGDYINAVLLPSFTRQNQQILTQLPQPTSVVDFYRLVMQYKVKLIVAFEPAKSDTDETVADYLPANESEIRSVSHFKVTTQPASTTAYWKRQMITLKVDVDKMAKATTSFYAVKERNVTHITCTTTDLDPGFLLAVIEEVRSHRPGADERILYTCRNGADYSGFVCVLSLLLDRMDNDGCLTVPLVVGAIKAIRPQVVSTLEQYSLLYELLQQYSENMSEYSNFGNARS